MVGAWGRNVGSSVLFCLLFCDAEVVPKAQISMPFAQPVRKFIHAWRL